MLSNFIPHETITCDDRNPPCFNKKIENLIKKKNTLFKKKKKKKKILKILQTNLIISNI